MTFVEHLDELRRRLLWSLGALVLGMAVSFPFRKAIYNLLLLPQNARVQNMLADLVSVFGLRAHGWRFFELWLRVHAGQETPFVPNFRSPMEPFTALFKICIVAGVVLAGPFLLYQVWAFVLPALKASERRVAIPLLALLALFFLTGVLFAFFVAAPLLLEMSANLWRTADVLVQPENLWTFDEYLGFLFQLILAFGLAFELPLVMAFVARLGLVNAGFFREKRRYALFVLVVVSAVVTPGDVVPMLFMAVPLIGLYELGILFAAVAYRRRASGEALTDGSSG
jgi:sec-independent protein translocase protein TatC